MENRLILAINPGSTSTKIAVFDNTRSVFVKNIRHSTEDLKNFDSVINQFSFRKEIIMKELREAIIPLEKIEL